MNINEQLFSPRQHEAVKRFMESTGRRYVYGRTSEARAVAEQIEIDGFIDDLTSEKEFLGKPVVAYAELPADAEVLSAVVQAFPVTILKRLEASGLKYVDYYSFKAISGLDLPEIPYWVGAREHYEKNLHDYDAVYRALEDEESRAVFERVLNFRLNYDISQMYGFKTKLQEMYFEPFLNVKEASPVFYDVGAFDGYNSEHFARLYPGMKAAVLFEPIPQQADSLRAKYADDDRFSVQQYALSDREGEVRFSLNNTASRMTDGGDGIVVQVSTLDSFYKSSGLRPDVLKMDIEGAEIGALQGAVELIQSVKPNLAVSVYHDPSHLTEAFKIISSLNANYKYYLRHYTEGYVETVLFAVP